MSAQEQKNKRIGILATLVWHGALLLFFLVFMAWTEPDPPIPEYGIEFNLGSSEISEVQSDATESIEEAEEIQDSPVESETVDQGTEEIQDEVVDEVVEEVVETQETQSEPIETVDDSSPDTREEQPVIEKNQETEEDNEVSKESQKGEVEENPEETKKAEEKAEESPKIDERAIYKGKSDKAPGGNKGASLDFSGWMWDFKPQPNDQSDESGKIIFEVTVDEEGEILSVRKIESNVSPIVEKVYRDAVMELTFSREATNRIVAATSKGRITFIIQSK